MIGPIFVTLLHLEALQSESRPDFRPPIRAQFDEPDE